MAGLALVLGGASCLFDDLKALRTLLDPESCTVVAVNDAGFRWPCRIDHWATLHPEELAWRIDRRRKFGYSMDLQTWTRPYPAGMRDREKLCDHVLGGWEDGSSGLFGVGVALELGADRVILCGMPMDARPHLGRVGRPWNGHANYRDGWLAKLPILTGRVRSFSGWTAEILGRCDGEWLDVGALTAQ